MTLKVAFLIKNAKGESTLHVLPPQIVVIILQCIKYHILDYFCFLKYI